MSEYLKLWLLLMKHCKSDLVFFSDDIFFPPSTVTVTFLSSTLLWTSRNDLYAGPYIKVNVPTTQSYVFQIMCEKRTVTPRGYSGKKVMSALETNTSLNLVAPTIHLLLQTALFSHPEDSLIRPRYSHKGFEVSHDLGNLYTIITNRHFAWGPLLSTDVTQHGTLSYLEQ